MSVFDGTPPFDWVDGTNLEGTLLKSRQMCEAMQALTNRANLVEVDIPDWTAYDYDGTLLHNLGQIPSDNDLRASLLPTREGAYRRNEYFVALREALELVLVKYSYQLDIPFTLSSLLQRAVGRPSYNRTIQELWELHYFDGEDLEEILKCIDLLIETPRWIWEIYYREVGEPEFIRVLVTHTTGHRYKKELLAASHHTSHFPATTSAGTADMTNVSLNNLGSNIPVTFESSGTNSSLLEGPLEPPSTIELDRIEPLSPVQRAFELPFEMTYRLAASRDDINEIARSISIFGFEIDDGPVGTVLAQIQLETNVADSFFFHSPSDYGETLNISVSKGIDNPSLEIDVKWVVTRVII